MRNSRDYSETNFTVYASYSGSELIAPCVIPRSSQGINSLPTARNQEIDIIMINII